MFDFLTLTISVCTAFFDPIPVKGGGSITSYTVVETGERTLTDSPGVCIIVPAENGARRDGEDSDK